MMGRRVILVAALLSITVTCLLVLYGRSCCDSHWLGTLFAFGPKWPLLLPIVALALPVGIWYRQLLVVLGAAGLLILGPVMGYAVPWRGYMQALGTGPTIRVVSCNV